MEKGSILRPEVRGGHGRVHLRRSWRRSQASIETEDWDAFETDFATMVDQANAYHEKYDKGFLRWKLPATPPPDLDLTAT